MINLFFASSISNVLGSFQGEVTAYVQAITDYVLAFVRFIMPVMIYVIVFRIVMSKS